MSEELLDKLEQWHEEEEYEKIVEAVTEIPAKSRGYALTSHLGRALNNLERYEEAVKQFLSVKREGKEDPLWHYRIGLAYYYLERYEDARKAFETADRLEPGDEDTLEFLGWIESKLPKKPAKAPKAEAKADIGIDLKDFWEEGGRANDYSSEWPSDELIASVEEELVFRLPTFYVRMMKAQNGGVPRNRFYPLGESDSGTDGFIEISGISGIGRKKKRSLCGDLGSRATIENGGYPEIGVVICDCPSEAGVVMLDYRDCGNDGEPEIVYVDKENGYRITRLAPNFEAFVRGLVNVS
ncbi:SMI1/KNR4 family protein [Cohnella algarum]|uniref:SMI1/KNR4 family protein n=1 Tax=Cohnella algarum TaxID=2044859 RepID=UPI0019673CB2|nr:SMI1/KNR4 family protein [Cohnella algarum]MBN2981022.1 SMI1/KNR4 family protein [Cohnella algarum]